MGPTLALFDLDDTLLSGDSDTLWCEFLVREGLAPPALSERNRSLDADYRSGTVTVDAYCSFHAALLAGRTPAQWAPWRERFLLDVVRPRIPAAARALVQRHRAAGHQLVLTTAANRAVAEGSAAELGFVHLIATELELVDGRYSGRVAGTPNMREGKVERLHAWLAAQGLPAAVLAAAHFYSDSVNDLPLLGAVGFPVTVDPGERLLAHAVARCWPVMRLARESALSSRAEGGAPAAGGASGERRL
jgi:HAD superfamily hydrolase (TIGR01490 family)